MSSWINQVAREDVQNFLKENEHIDARELVLKSKTMFGIPTPILADQIRGRKKAKDKHPILYNTTGICYPPSLNIEQSSSTRSAEYKLSILQEYISTIDSIVDLTGGFGIDTYFFSTLSKHVSYVEPNADLQEIVKHNHQQLGATNITYSQSTAEAFIDQTNDLFTVSFIDPSRRVDDKKTFKLADCIPNVVALQDQLLLRSEFVLIKAAPWLDIDQALRELNHVRMVYVVSIDDECKELLFLLDKTFTGIPLIKAVNLNQGQDDFLFTQEEERQAAVTYREPATYLYEPNSSILKSGAFKLISQRYQVAKLHQHTHWYTSDVLIDNFPGRIFKHQAEIKSNVKDVVQAIPSGRANVVVRNYPLGAEALKSKLKIKDGGDVYVLGFTGISKKHIVVASRIQ
jgi:hypothetical protein